FHVDVEQMNGHAAAAGVLGPIRLVRGCRVEDIAVQQRILDPFRDRYRRLEVVRFDSSDSVAVEVDQASLPIALEDGAEYPAVAVEVGEVLLRHVRVKRSD